MKFTFAVSILLIFLSKVLVFGLDELQDKAFTLDDYTLFLCHFDKTVDADFAHGEKTPNQNGVTLVDGKFSNGVLIDGQDTLIYNVGKNIDSRRGTMELWLRPKWGYEATEYQEICSVVDNTGKRFLNLYFRPTYQDFHLYSDIQEVHLGKSITFEPDTWIHLAITWDNTKGISLFINGEYVDSHKGEWEPIVLSKLWVGTYPGGKDLNQVDGVIDELRISDVVRYGKEGKPITNFPKGSVLLCQKTSKPPIIDGILNDPCWKDSSKITGFVSDAGVIASDQTIVSVVYDMSNLYIAFECFDSKMGKIVAEKKEHDSDVYQDDSVELFLDTKHDHRTYFHIGSNSIGTLFDRKVEIATGVKKVDLEWNPTGIEVKNSRYDDHWTVEMRIPFKDIGTLPEEGDIWGINFAREKQHMSKEWSMWSNTYNGFNIPTEFGDIYFGGEEISLNGIYLSGFSKGEGCIVMDIKNTREKPLVIIVRIDIRPGDMSKQVVQELTPRKSEEVIIFLDLKEPGVYNACITISDRDTGRVYYRSEGPRFYSLSLYQVADELKDKLNRLKSILDNIPGEKERNPGIEKAFYAGIVLIKQNVDEFSGTIKTLKSAKEITLAEEKGETLSDQVGILYTKVNSYVKTLNIIQKPEYGLGVDTGMVKTPKDREFKGDYSSNIHISIARNEYESAQIVIIPYVNDFEKVNVEISDLKGKNAIIKSDNVQWNRVGYLHTRKPSYETEYIGWWADPLFEEGSFSVKKDELQPIWITVYAPKDTPAGDYIGEVIITPANSHPARVNLNVRIWDFTLPDKMHLKTSFWLHRDHIRYFYNDERWVDNVPFDEYKKYYDLLFSHRISCQDIPEFRLPKTGEYVYDRKQTLIRIFREKDGSFSIDYNELDKYLDYWVAKGMNNYGLDFIFWAGWGKVLGYIPVYDRITEKRLENIPGFSSKDEEAIYFSLQKDLYQHMVSKGIDLEDIVFNVWDEPGIDAYSEIVRRSKILRKEFPGLNIRCAGVNPHPQLIGYMNIWCPLTASLNQEACDIRRVEGDEIWWYVTGWPVPPYPSLHIDEEGINHRIIFWMNWKYNINGFLYWGVNYWTGKYRTINVEKDPDKRWPNNRWDTFSHNAGINGDGYLIYPGHEGPLSSLRLENIRDGIEDYEYFYILNERIREIEKNPDKRQRHASLLRDAKEAVIIKEDIVKSLREYTKDPTKIYITRENVAKAIEKLGSLN